MGAFIEMRRLFLVPSGIVEAFEQIQNVNSLFDETRTSLHRFTKRPFPQVLLVISAGTNLAYPKCLSVFPIASSVGWMAPV